MDVINLDFRKAFDSVPHGRLIRKLRKTKFHRCLFELDNSISDAKKDEESGEWIGFDVGQRAQRSTTGISIRTTPVPAVCERSSKLCGQQYTTLPTTPRWTKLASDDSSWSLQSDLDGLCHWSDKWLLKFNTQKCKLLTMSFSAHHLQVSKSE